MVIQNFDFLNFVVNGDHKLPPDSESPSVNCIEDLTGVVDFYFFVKKSLLVPLVSPSPPSPPSPESPESPHLSQSQLLKTYPFRPCVLELSYKDD